MDRGGFSIIFICKQFKSYVYNTQCPYNKRILKNVLSYRSYCMEIANSCLNMVLFLIAATLF